MTSPRFAALLSLAVLAAAFGVYWGSLDNDFVWDDPIVLDRQLPFFDSVANVLKPPLDIPQFGQHYYRPLIVVTYLVDEGLAKTFWPQAERDQARRIVYHVTPVIYHALASVLVLLLGLCFLPSAETEDRASMLAVAAGALLFAVHPIHVESVSWMTGRSDVVCSLFFFGALIATARYVRGGRGAWLGAIAVLAFAAMMAKETAVALLAAAPITALLVRPAPAAPSPPLAAPGTRANRRRPQRAGGGQRPRGSALRGRVALAFAALIPATVVYFVLRWDALSTLDSPAMQQWPPAEKVWAAVRAVGWYIVKSVWPTPQSAFIPRVPESPLYALLGVAATLAFGFLLLRYGRRGQFARELLAAMLFFTSLAASLLIVMFSISETPIAERYLYMPTAGICLLFGLLLERAARRPPATSRERARLALPAAAALLIAIPAAATTVTRVEVWNGNLPFWLDAVAKAPFEGIPHLHLGIVYAHSDKPREAAEQYELALKYYNDNEGRSKANNNLGSLLMTEGRYDEAIAHFRQALEQDEHYDSPHYNWALVLVHQAEATKDRAAQRPLVAEALEHFEMALQINPRYVKAHYQYGALLVRLGRIEPGVSHLREAIALAPASPEADDSRRILGVVQGQR